MYNSQVIQRTQQSFRVKKCDMAYMSDLLPLGETGYQGVVSRACVASDRWKVWDCGQEVSKSNFQAVERWCHPYVVRHPIEELGCPNSKSRIS